MSFSKFRCSNHQLAIEQGRLSDILCNARNCVVVEDEYHFLLICDDYKLLKHRYVTKHFTSIIMMKTDFKHLLI